MIRICIISIVCVVTTMACVPDYVKNDIINDLSILYDISNDNDVRTRLMDRYSKGHKFEQYVDPKGVGGLLSVLYNMDSESKQVDKAEKRLMFLKTWGKYDWGTHVDHEGVKKILSADCNSDADNRMRFLRTWGNYDVKKIPNKYSDDARNTLRILYNVSSEQKKVDDAIEQLKYLRFMGYDWHQNVRSEDIDLFQNTLNSLQARLSFLQGCN